MTTLKEASLKFKGKRELWDLDSVAVDVEIKDDVFTGDGGKQVPFQFIEIDGWKYTIRAKNLEAIKNIIEMRPQTTKVKFKKTDKGDILCMPVD